MPRAGVDMTAYVIRQHNPVVTDSVSIVSCFELVVPSLMWRLLLDPCDVRKREYK